MMGKLRVLASALGAVFALSGLGAQAVQAETFQAESYPAAISGSQIEGKHLFKTVANTLYCNKFDFTGELSSASNELALNAIPQECSTAGVIVMSVNMNGCTFNFNVGKELGEGEHAGSVHIACPAGKEIVWSATNGCTAKIPAQTISATVTLQNKATEPKKSIRLSTVATGIKYTIEKGFFCLGAPGSGEYNNGTYEGVTTLTGKDSKTEPVGITVK